MKSLTLVLLLLAASKGSSQSTPTHNAACHDVTIHLNPVFTTDEFAELPYSAEEVSEYSQALSDGTRVTHTTARMKEYHDSHGRTRTEQRSGPDLNSELFIVFIIDPVAGVQYALEPRNQVAYRAVSQGPPMAPNNGVGGAAAGQPDPEKSGSPTPQEIEQMRQLEQLRKERRESKVEQLAPQIIEGLLAEGRRRTVMIPAGAEGNQKPFREVIETWVSPDLRVTLLQKSNGPDGGETITRLTNIDRSEPDPSLFQPPPDYRIVDTSGKVTIHCTP
jgi:hypothetical protein